MIRFTPLPMKHVQLQLLTSDLPQACLVLAELRVFAPDFRPFPDQGFTDTPGARFRQLYRLARERLDKVSRHIRLPERIRLQRGQPISEPELERTCDWLGLLWQRCSTFEEAFRRFDEEEAMIDQLEQALANFRELDIDLGRLQGERRFLDLRVGLLPSGNLEQLRDAVRIAGYLLFDYLHQEKTTHVVVVGPKGVKERELGSVLDTAGFQPLAVPDEILDQPQRVRERLRERRSALAGRREQKRREMERCADEVRERLQQARATLALAAPFVQVETAAHSANRLAILCGWVPARELKRTRAALEEALPHPFQLRSRNPTATERPLVPSSMPAGSLLAPFATLVRQYGIPRYGEIDPTPLFALTFLAMFGMMFGDIGHGAVIALTAWLARRKLRSFTPFVIGAGASAALFGLFYGSLFGYEGVISPVWIPPLSDPLYMLTVALLWGIGFLLLISLIFIHNRLIEGERMRALFDTNGLIATLFYLSLLYGLYTLYRDGRFNRLAAVTGVVSLLLLLGYRIGRNRSALGERLLIALIETFEAITGYISNTLSFLRVAAFSLNHVALAIAVFTLAEMIESTHGHLLMVLFGNLFILVLEGAIVTIQALRLEYYEGFSRFYSGDGIGFEPLALPAEVSP